MSPERNHNLHLAANAQDMRFETIFRVIQRLLQQEGIPLILLKGPHLAHTVYDHPHERIYGDLDILVKPGDFNKAARILLENKFTLLEDNEKNLATMTQTNHWAFLSRSGQLIELHRGFTGLDRHPIDLDAWFARAEEFNYGQTPALGLATEDFLCHLCLHIGKSFFYIIEPKHIQDLDVLIRKRKIGWDAFISRCQETRSRTIAFYCLSAAMAQYRTPVPGAVRSALLPRPWRRKWLDKYLNVSAFPIYRFHLKGVEHARWRLTLPLLDGVGNWIPFVARVTWVRGLDVVLRVPLFGRLWKKKVDSRQ